MKSKFLLLFASIFVIFSFVGGTICLNADTLFSTSTEVVQQDEQDDETKIQATGSWYSAGSYMVNPPLSGSGTSSNPFKITSETDMATFLFYANSGRYMNGVKVSDSYVELETSLDLSAHYWDPIGDGKNPFTGHFDGNGYKISEMIIHSSSDEDYEGTKGYGLFGIVSGATIENFTLRYVTITLDSNASRSYNYSIGAVAGIVIGESRFEDITVYGTGSSIEISYSSWSNLYNRVRIGGIVGTCESSAEFVDCFNYADISGDEFANVTAGGIVGFAKGGIEISSCANLGDITGTASKGNAYGFGGIVGAIGFVSGDSSRIEDCVNYGSLQIKYSGSSVSQYVGGIVGYGIQSVYINRCINYGSLRGRAHVGGLVGKLGSADKSGSFQDVTWSQGTALTSVLVANSINYGTVSGTSYYGTIAGELNGENSARSCYTGKSGTTVGAWNNKGSTGSEIVTLTSGNVIYMSTFFRTPANSTMTSHDSNFNGSKDGLSFTGWDRITVGLNGNNGSGQWVLTTLLYNAGYTTGLNSTYKYSMAPTSMIGAMNFKLQYKRGDDTIYSFAKGDDSIGAYFDMIVGTSVESTNLWTYSYASYYNVPSDSAQFYYLRGHTGTGEYLNFENLVFKYNATVWGTEEITDSQGLVSAYFLSPHSPNVYGQQSMTNYISFRSIDRLATSTTPNLSIVFQGESFTNQTFQIRVGTLQKGVDGKTNAQYTFSNVTSSIGVLDEYSNDYLSITTGNDGWRIKSHYYGDVLNATITPTDGYAILFTRYKSSSGIDSNTYDESLNPNKDVHPVNKYFSGSSYIETIEPSWFDAVEVSYEYKYYYTMTIFVVPIEYHLEIRCGDGEEMVSVDTTACGRRTNSTASQVKYASFYRNERGKLNEANLLEVPFTSFLEDGWGYDLYASYSENIYTVYEGKEMIPLSSPLNQLSDDQDLRFSLVDMVSTAIANGGTRGNTIYIQVNKVEIEYKVQFVSLVNSYTDPDYYQNRTSQGIGGSASFEEESYAVSENFGYMFNPKYGYKPAGLSFTQESSLNSRVSTTLGGMSVEGSYSTYKYAKFEDFVKAYTDFVNSNPSFTPYDSEYITVFVYYELQTYRVYYSTEYCTGSINQVYYAGPGLELESRNSSEQMEGETSEGHGGLYKEVYYYAPVTLYTVKNFLRNSTTFWDFIGWWERPIKFDVPDSYWNIYSSILKDRFYDLLSLNTEYTFFVDPTDVGNEETRSITNTSDYEIYMVAMYETFVHDETPLKEISPNVFEVSTAQDLVKLSTSVRLGNSYEGCVIKQTADFDINDSERTSYRYCLHLYPIGTEENPFKGTYDGQYHKIGHIDFGYGRGMYRYDVGLFGYTDGATIKNLTIETEESMYVLNTGLAAVGNAGVFIANAKDTTMINLNNYGVNVEFQLVSDGTGIRIPYNVQFYTDNNYGWVDVYDSSRNNIPELENAGEGDIQTLVLPRKQDDPSAYDGKYFGGIVGKMEGGSIYASSVQAQFWLNGSQRDQCAGLIGQISDGATIDECYVWDITRSTRRTNYDVLTNYLDDDPSTGFIINSYFRDKFGTKYYNSKLEDDSFADFEVEDRGGSSGSYSLNRDIWFQLPNGYWTLKVFYWT